MKKVVQQGEARKRKLGVKLLGVQSVFIACHRFLHSALQFHTKQSFSQSMLSDKQGTPLYNA